MLTSGMSVQLIDVLEHATMMTWVWTWQCAGDRKLGLSLRAQRVHEFRLYVSRSSGHVCRPSQQMYFAISTLDLRV
jgi:hypothetical protein